MTPSPPRRALVLTVSIWISRDTKDLHASNSADRVSSPEQKKGGKEKFQKKSVDHKMLLLWVPSAALLLLGLNSHVGRTRGFRGGIAPAAEIRTPAVLPSHPQLRPSPTGKKP